MNVPMKAVFSLALAALLAALAMPMRAEILEQVLVKVNGDIFTKTDLEQRQIAALRQRNAGALKDEELKKALAEVTPQVLVDAIDELLLVQMGRDKGYHLSDAQFKEWLDNLRKQQDLTDDAKFQSALKQEGMSIDDLRKNVERQFLISQVQREEVGSKLSITEEEARQYYLTHKDQFTEQANVTLREILIEVPTTTQGGQKGVNVGQEDEVKTRADAVRARLSAGEDFGKVASEVSASSSKANGGLIGPINTAELSPQLVELLAKMKPGDMTQPLRTQRGFQILKLESSKPAAVQPFDSVRDLVADKVHDARQQAEVRKFLSRIRTQAIIEWKNEELKKAYEKALATPEAAGH
jgi:parvulin-like peptidyl-prolyl isomerase